MPGEDAPVLFNRYGSILDGLSGVDYSCAGLEISDVQRALRLSGQPFRYHVQAVIFFKNARTFSAVKSIFPGAHLEKVNGPPLVASNYCKKGEQSHQEWENDGPLGVNYGYNSMIDERGVLPLSRAEVSAKGGATTAAHWQVAKDLAMAGKVNEIDAQIYVKFYGNLCSIAKNNVPLPGDLDGVCGLWFYGASGTGKSRKARDDYPGAFMKQPTKWWDGYNQEESVIVDDLDKNDHKWMGYYLKIWADRYAFRGEIKGASVTLRPKVVVVTSNWAPASIWDDIGTLDPILRRFKVFRFGPDCGQFEIEHEWRDLHSSYAPNFPPPNTPNPPDDLFPTAPPVLKRAIAVVPRPLDVLPLTMEDVEFWSDTNLNFDFLDHEMQM